MAIETQCPHCRKAYRLPDELADKKVTCKGCRQTFTVAPAAVAAAPARPARPAQIDAESLAAQAFAEEVAAPVENRVVPMTCAICEHKWAEPWDRQGKNVLCPECRHRQKVPEQKVVKPSDWRQGRGGPSLAKQPTLDNVVSTNDMGYVTGATLNKMGIGRPEVEPRPVWHKVAFVAFPLAVLGLGTLLVMSFNRSRAEVRNEKAMTEAVKDAPDASGGLPPAELPLARAALFIAAGEYAAVHPKDKPEELVEAVRHFGLARQELANAATSLERDLLFVRLAELQTLLGGSTQQVNESQRIRWVPQAPGTARARISEKVYDVQGELRQTYTAVAGAAGKPVALDARHLAIRHAARAFAKAGVPEAAERLVPVLFPDDGEQRTAAAWVGFELSRAGAPVELIESLVKGQYGTLTPNRPASPPLVALAQSLPKPPAGAKPPTPPAAGPLDDATRTTVVAAALLKKAYPEAVEAAKRPGSTESRLKMLALAGECADDPAAAVEAAAAIAAPSGHTRDGGVIDPLTLVRLAALAGRANADDAVFVTPPRRPRRQGVGGRRVAPPAVGRGHAQAARRVGRGTPGREGDARRAPTRPALPRPQQRPGRRRVGPGRLRPLGQEARPAVRPRRAGSGVARPRRGEVSLNEPGA